MMFDPLYLVMLIPVLLFSGWASLLTQSRFARYSKVRAYSGMTGARAAHRMLQAGGVHDVVIARSRGMLSDHYDPRTKTLRLSDEVHDGVSLAAIGVACHEAGHALQHAQGYAALGLRSMLVPVAQFGSTLAPWIFIVGMLGNFGVLMDLAIVLLAAMFLFTLVTLPVEYNASARAKEYVVAAGLVSPNQAADTGKVLNAAFMTYLAAAAAALFQLLYFIMRRGRR